jgi:hypothetical protein
MYWICYDPVMIAGQDTTPVMQGITIRCNGTTPSNLQPGVSGFQIPPGESPWDDEFGILYFRCNFGDLLLSAVFNHLQSNGYRSSTALLVVTVACFTGVESLRSSLSSDSSKLYV